MSMNAPGGVFRAAVCAGVLAVSASASVRPALAAANYPDIPVWSNPGTWQDSSLVNSFRCVGSFQAPLAESLKVGARAITVRFLRDRTAELRPDFGGYRLYRMINSPDSSAATLIRRFSLNPGSELTWNFSRVSRSSRISILPGNGDGTFGARRDVSSGVSPVSIAGANLNKDGRLDLATANEGSNSVSMFVGLAGGGVVQTGTQNARGVPAGLATADLDADTVSDVIVASRDQNLVTLLLSGVISDTSYATGNQPSAVAAGDLNADARPDVVVANEGSATVSVFLGTSRGRLGLRSDFPTQLAPSAVAIGKLNADTQGDLVVANRGSNTVSVFLGIGGGSFGPRSDLPVGSAPAGVAIQDVSGDGFADIVVANSGDATVSVLLGNGDGTFGPSTPYATGLAPRSVAIGDLNADGKPDLGVANEGAASVSVLLGNGTGGFGTKSDFATDLNPSSLVIGELTGDTKPDLAVANRSYTVPFLCNSGVVNDSIVTFVDPDSNGQYQKVCRRRTPDGRCIPPSDSMFILVAPPGPHDGFLTWYAVTYEKRNTTDPDYEDLFLPDTLNNFARCTDPLDRKTCPNLNHKLRNLAGPVEPTSGPAPNLERVLAVPNPYRGHETWDQPGQREVHFINLPAQSKIRIYTIAGDLVRVILHNDKVRDFERWDLKNDSGKLVASGIYIYRVESATFHFQNRLVVIL
jgi:VCBS repeat protein